jgi:hypothetical protein
LKAFAVTEPFVKIQLNGKSMKDSGDVVLDMIKGKVIPGA